MKFFQADDGARQTYAESGEPGGGPTLLLVHGFPLSHAMWRAQIQGLSDDCHVVAPNLRGFDASALGDWPADDSPTLGRYADDLIALIEHLDPKGPVVLVGFSMGGYIAFELLRRRPELIDALALFDTRSEADGEQAVSMRLKMADKVGEWGGARVAELMRPSLFSPGTPEEIVNQTVVVIASTDPAAIAAAQRAMAARPDSTDLLATIDQPTLVLVGAEDAMTRPAEMRSMAGRIRGSQFVEVAGAGHMAPVERPEAVSEALRAFALSL